MIHRYRIPCTFTGAPSPSLLYGLNGAQRDLKRIFSASTATLLYPKALENFPIPQDAVSAAASYQADFRETTSGPRQSPALFTYLSIYLFIYCDFPQ